MRPRVFPAEDAMTRPFLSRQRREASMRPRVFPAEDSTMALKRTPWPRFNEAAGIPRGRLRHSIPSSVPGRRFNEAAGIPRGRRTPPTGSRSSFTCFNEAAGIPRGRRMASAVAGLRGRASMRPRVFPAEWVFRRKWNTESGGSGTSIPEEVEQRIREVEHGIRRKWNIDSGGSGTAVPEVVNARR